MLAQSAAPGGRLSATNISGSLFINYGDHSDPVLHNLFRRLHMMLLYRTIESSLGGNFYGLKPFKFNLI